MAVNQHSRRDFMKTSVAGAAAVVAANSFISQSAYAASSSNEIKIALIGCVAAALPLRR
jgi:anaerobic selenocysteine-containing dehydrogenase